MKTRTLKELLLYNYRYWFGYSIIIGFIVYFLGWRINDLPMGLSQPEIDTAAAHLDWLSILQTPLYPLHSALQWLSMELFDVSTWSIRLPGLLIGLLTALTLYKLLRRWFGKPTALLGTAIFISADWFLFIARIGTGAVEFSLWLSLALLCFTKLLERKTKWLILYTASLALLLFIPFGIYAVAALLTGLFTSRVFRERANEAGFWVKLLSGLSIIAGLALCSWASIQNTDFLKAIFGLQSIPSPLEYGKNVLNNLGGVVAVLPAGNPSISPTGVFFVRFFEFIFILFGVIMFWRTRVNRLNVLVLVLSIVLALVSGLSDGSRGNGLMLIPAAIFITAGLRHLLHRWQKIFPKNPYARVTAYLPLLILLICTVSLHYVSYFELWQNQPGVRAAYARDYELLQTELQKTDYSSKRCYIDSGNQSLDMLLSKASLQCSTEFPHQDSKVVLPEYTVTKPGSSLQAAASPVFVKVLTNETVEDNVRWLIIENNKAN